MAHRPLLRAGLGRLAASAHLAVVEGGEEADLVLRASDEPSDGAPVDVTLGQRNHCRDLPGDAIGRSVGCVGSDRGDRPVGITLHWTEPVAGSAAPVACLERTPAAATPRPAERPLPPTRRVKRPSSPRRLSPPPSDFECKPVPTPPQGVSPRVFRPTGPVSSTERARDTSTDVRLGPFELSSRTNRKRNVKSSVHTSK